MGVCGRRGPFHTDHLELKLLFSLLSELNKLSLASRTGHLCNERDSYSFGFQEGMSCIKIASQAMQDGSGQPSLSGPGSWPFTPISILA